MELFNTLVNKDWSFWTLITSFFMLCLSQFIEVGYPIILLCGITLFTSFDIIGYESVAHSANRNDLVRYRIIQTMVQWLVVFILGVLTQWNAWVVFGFVYLWWMGVCDMLFYVILGKYKQLLSYGDMHWLWWTPIGNINKIIGRKTSGLEVFYITTYSVIMWLSIWVFKESTHNKTIMDVITYLFK